MKGKFSVAIFTAAILCASALAQEDTAEDWFNKGQELFSNGSMEEAVKAYDKAIELDPQYGWAWGGKATALSILGRHNESLEAYDKAIDTWPANDTERISQLWVFKGITLNSTGRKEDAFKSFEKALEIFSQNTDALMWKGEALENQGKYSEAVEVYNVAIDVAPSIPAAKASALNSKGDALMGLGSYQEAYDSYDEAAKISSNSKDDAERFHLAAALRGEGNALAKLKRYNESLQAFDRAIELYPDDADAWLGKANTLFESNFGRIPDRQSMNESIKAYDQAISLIPTDSTQKLAGAWEKKAYALANLGDMMSQYQALYEESIRAYERAIELDPQRASARTGKASVLATRLNRSDEAAEISSSAVDLSTDLSSNNTCDGEGEEQIRALEVQAVSLVKVGKYEEANQTYDRLLETAPENSYAMSFAWQGKGNALFGMKRYEEAITAYDRAIEAYPSNMDKLLSSGIWEGKGDTLEAMGRHEEAIAAYDKVIDAHPKNAFVIYKKGQILKALGRNSEADAAFAKARDLGYRPKMVTAVAGSGPFVAERVEMVSEAAHSQGAGA